MRWGERSRVSSSVKDWNDRVLDVYRTFTISNTAPTSPAVGEGWQTLDGSRAVWNGSAWVAVSPLVNNSAIGLVAIGNADLVLDTVEFV